MVTHRSPPNATARRRRVTVFVVEELRGQGFGQFGFAHPCGPGEEEGASLLQVIQVIHKSRPNKGWNRLENGELNCKLKGGNWKNRKLTDNFSGFNMT